MLQWNGICGILEQTEYILYSEHVLISRGPEGWIWLYFCQACAILMITAYSVFWYHLKPLSLSFLIRMNLDIEGPGCNSTQILGFFFLNSVKNIIVISWGLDCRSLWVFMGVLTILVFSPQNMKCLYQLIMFTSVSFINVL